MAPGGAEAPPPPPPMSDEEKDLMKKQSAAIDAQSSILQTQFKQQQLLAPIMYKQFGITPQYNEAGEIVGYQDQNPADEAVMKQIRENSNNITLAQQNRTLKAFRGELPIDPGLEKQFTIDENELRNRLIAQFGPGYETTSAGIEALANMKAKHDSIRYGAARDEMSLGEQLQLASTAQLDQQQTQRLSNIYGINSEALKFGQAYGQVAGSYGQAQQPYQAYRGAMGTWAGQKAGVDSANAAGQGQMIGAGVGAAAAIGGAAIIF